MTLLVTGGAGFVGSAFVARRRRLYPTEPLVVLDALTYAGRRGAVPHDVPLVVGDVCDGPRVAKTIAHHGIDRIVHLAAESHVDRSIFGPVDFARTNVLGTATLLEEARKAHVRRFLHVSTDEVYGALGRDDAKVAPPRRISSRTCCHPWICGSGCSRCRLRGESALGTTAG